ncbi:MAG: hypothetical protein SLAVMIC_00769 [uncultured marine phage]|uniref:Uncharacterized protein n=1 Tax=uncultured marine phage TaxID=707152 RepID=A0A8D9CAK8_9VIRU|nr:MAG: hypothetical protein SLAVMIC_00769 [uncultured marine phage]
MITLLILLSGIPITLLVLLITDWVGYDRTLSFRGKMSLSRWGWIGLIFYIIEITYLSNYKN